MAIWDLRESNGKPTFFLLLCVPKSWNAIPLRNYFMFAIALLYFWQKRYNRYGMFTFE